MHCVGYEQRYYGDCGTLYAVVRQISMLFTDNKDSEYSSVVSLTL